MNDAAVPPSPQLVFDTAIAYQRTAALKAAVDLDLFTAIAEGAATPPDLAARRGVAERGARILCDYLAVNGFLAKEGGRYSLTRDSAVFLDRRSPAYLGGALEFLASPHMIAGFLSNPAEMARRGGTTMGDGGTTAPESSVWVKFARGMAPVATITAEMLAERVLRDAKPGPRTLDIAAGHGLYGVAVARRDPQARITALDWPNVLEVARENAGKAGVAERFATIAGSAFDADLKGPYDLILVPNFLHHFDAPTCTSFLRRVHGALAPGGRVAVLEFMPNEDRVSPPMAAAFAFVMLGTTPAGDAYTAKELAAMLRDAGFARSVFEDLPPPVQQQIAIAER